MNTIISTVVERTIEKRHCVIGVDLAQLALEQVLDIYLRKKFSGNQLQQLGLN